MKILVQEQGNNIMNTEEIQIEVAGKELDFVVEFNFTKGTPGVYHLAPEDCYPSEPDEYEVTALYCIGYEQGKRKQYDVSYMLEFINDEVVEILECIIND